MKFARVKYICLHMLYLFVFDFVRMDITENSDSLYITNNHVSLTAMVGMILYVFYCSKYCKNVLLLEVLKGYIYNEKRTLS